MTERILSYLILITIVVLAVMFSLRLTTDNPEMIVQNNQQEKQQPEKLFQMNIIEEPLVIKPPPPPPPPTPTKKRTAVGAGKKINENGSYSITAEFGCDVLYYLKIMEQMGAMSVLYEQTKGHFVQIAQNVALTPLNGISGAYSPIARRLTDDHPQARSLIRKAQRTWGYGSYEILLMLPITLEQKITRFLDSVIANNDINNPSSVQVIYHRSGNSLEMTVSKIIDSGNPVPVKASIVL